MVKKVFGDGNIKFKKHIIEHEVLDIKVKNEDEGIFILKSNTKVFKAYKSLIEKMVN